MVEVPGKSEHAPIRRARVEHQVVGQTHVVGVCHADERLKSERSHPLIHINGLGNLLASFRIGRAGEGFAKPDDPGEIITVSVICGNEVKAISFFILPHILDINPLNG